MHTKLEGSLLSYLLGGIGIFVLQPILLSERSPSASAVAYRCILEARREGCPHPIYLQGDRILVIAMRVNCMFFLGCHAQPCLDCSSAVCVFRCR